MFNKRNFIILLIICALAVGFLNVFSDLLKINSLANEGKEYYPFIFGGDDTYVLGPRIREVLDGHLIVRDINTYEYKNYPSVWLPLPPLLYYPILKLTNNIVNTIIISNFLFPALIFLLLYCLAYIITKKKFLSLFFACFFALHHEASIHFPPFVLWHLKNFIKILFPFDIGSNPVASFLTARESLIPCFPIFLAGIIFTYLNYKHDKKIYIVLMGVFYALNAYSYPFHFIYLSVAIFVLLIILCFQKQWHIIKRFILSFLVSLIVLIPFFIIQIQLRMLPQYYDIIGRQGLEKSHLFRASYWKEYVWYLLFSFSVFLWGLKTGRQKIAYFIISFILAGILVLNMQVVLGFNMQPSHWETRTIFLGLSLGWLIAFWWLSEYFKKNNLTKNICIFLGGIIIISLITHSIHFQLNNNKESYSTYTIPEYMQESFDWLNNNTEIDSVVASPAFSTTTLIPMYTHNNLFVPFGINTIASEDEIIERLIITYKLFGVKREQLTKFLKPNLNKEYKEVDNMDRRMNQIEDSGMNYLFCYKYIGDDFDIDTRYAKIENNLGKIPQELYEKIMDKYDSFDLEKTLNQYRVDYLYLGPREKKISFADFINFEKVYSSKGVEIYKYDYNKIIK